MNDPQNKKEVLFHDYCKRCKHWHTPEWEDPCDECLTEPCNINSHKPINFKEVEKNG